MYSSVQSPNLSFLGTPSLSRLSNSFLINSFRGKPPEILSSLIKPLLPTSTAPTSEDQQQQKQEDVRKSSHYLPPSRKASSLQRIPEDHRPMVGGHEVGPYRQCSYIQGVMNGKQSHKVYQIQLFFISIFWQLKLKARLHCWELVNAFLMENDILDLGYFSTYFLIHTGEDWICDDNMMVSYCDDIYVNMR